MVVTDNDDVFELLTHQNLHLLLVREVPPVATQSLGCQSDQGLSGLLGKVPHLFCVQDAPGDFVTCCHYQEGPGGRRTSGMSSRLILLPRPAPDAPTVDRKGFPALPGEKQLRPLVGIGAGDETKTYEWRWEHIC